MEVDISTFVSPHFFFIIEKNGNYRYFLKNISEIIGKSLVEVQNDSFEVDEVVAVYHEKELVRAAIQFECNKEYYCWLLDYGVLIKTETVFKLSSEVKDIKPLAKQVILSNIGYIKTALELGVTGTVKLTPSAIPAIGVFKYCLYLISDSTKLVLNVLDYDSDIIIGELLIHKNNKIFKLSDELIKEGLLIRDEVIFKGLKDSAKDYMKNHLNFIFHAGQNTSFCSNSINLSESYWDENDVGKLLENGRRRFKNKVSLEEHGAKANVTQLDGSKASDGCSDISYSSGTTKFSPSQKIQTNNSRLIQKLKEKEMLSNSSDFCMESDCSSSTNEHATDPKSKSRVNVEILRKKLAEIKSKPELSTNNENISKVFGSPTPLEEERNVEMQITKKSLSPFSDVTSEKTSKYNLNFLPAGMSPKNKALKKSPNISRHYFNENTASSSLANDSDCPTIKVSRKVSEQLISEDRSKNHNKIDDSSTDIEDKPSGILTKRDFCKLMSNGCNCKDCKMVYEDDDWDSPYNFIQANEKCETKTNSDNIIKPPRLLRDADEGDKTKEKSNVISLEYSDMTALQKQGANRLLVHGESIPHPIKLVSNINIHPDIYNGISRLNYKEAKKIQQYAFPALTRNQDLIMINDSKSGKTMAYLPILISFIKEKNERYSQLMKMGGGPLVVLLCSHSRKAEEVYDLIRIILDKQKCKMNLVTYPGYGNISNVDILITIPVILSSLISTRATNFKRLCHFVLEDGDTILNLHQDLINKFLIYADQVLENRHCPKSVQVIICAEHWTQQIEDILKRLNKVPLVCIGNYLEAAVYGKMNFTMKFLEASCKNQELKQILGDVFKYTKSVIICNFDDIGDIETFLMLKGIDYITVKDNMSQEDILFYENQWNCCVPGKYSVLICTDNIYNTFLTITNASLLVHYSLPNSWSQFVRRFSCLLENITTPLHKKLKGINVGSVVFVDENCESKMSKFSKFIKKSGLEKYLPDKVKAYFEGVELRGEQCKVDKGIELCRKIKLFGHCSTIQCLKRHIINKDIDVSDYLPKNGYVKFKIQLMTNTTTASIKLVEHFDLYGNSIKVFEDLTEYVSDILERNKIYSKAEDMDISGFFLYKKESSYLRCKLIEKGANLLVFLLDSGIYCKADPSELFMMPQELKGVPQQCFEVYFANLIPPHEDSTFCRLSRSKAQFFVNSECPAAVMKGTVKLQLSDHLWLSDVCEEKEMFDKSLPSVGFQFTRELMKAGLVTMSTEPIEKLYTLIRKVGIELPEYNLPKFSPKPVITEQIKPQWAFLDVDEITDVMFSCAVNPEEFYVRKTQFYKQLLDLEKYILKEIQKPFYPSPQSLEAGKYYLVKDGQSNNYSRALLLNVDNNHAHVFFVDYGDDVFVDASALKYLRNDMISRLPFQSIQCCMHGVQPILKDIWCDEAINLLYDKGFEPGTDIFRSLYVKVHSKQSNNHIQKRNSYKVTVKYGCNERDILLNQLLVDCGFALPDGNAIEDFDIAEIESSTEDDFHSDESVDGVLDEKIINYNIDGIGESDDYELVIYDIEKFLIDLKLINPDHMKQTGHAHNTSNNNNNMSAIKAAPVVDFLTPEIIWYQTVSHLKISINVQDVRDYKMNLFGNRGFYFSTEKSGKKYMVKLILFETVNKTFQHTVLGSQVRVTLKKCIEAEWPRLLMSTEKNKKVHYDISMIKDEDKPRKFLELELSDSCSSDDELNGFTYHVCSDMDSEYDHDIPNENDL